MTSTTRKPVARKAPAKPAPKATPAKVPAPKEQPAPRPAARKTEPKQESTTLIEALTTGQAILVKVRGDGTKRSLPYLAVGTEPRKQAEAVAKMKADGQTVGRSPKRSRCPTRLRGGSSPILPWPRRWRPATTTPRGTRHPRGRRAPGVMKAAVA